MGDPLPDFRPSPDAQDVANALRSGLAARRSPLDADARGADEARLRDLGDLEGLPPIAKPGPAAPIVKFLRRFLQVFLRPWLATQTIFNREIARRFQNMVTSVRDLERRAPHAEKGLEHLLARVQQLEERLAPPNLSQQDAGGDPGVDRSIERMFVHSRIPRPPSRVLTLDDGATGVAMELAAFGFDVWVADDGPNQDEHPKLRRYRPVLGALPFAEATFDVVVSLSSSARRVQKDPAYVEKDPGLRG